jgi:hypothetical protein
MEVIVKINTLEGSGPFKITWGGYLTGAPPIHTIQDTQNIPPLVASVQKWQLLNGFVFSVPTDLEGISRIRVSEMGPCNSFVDINILSEPGDAITELTPTENIKIIGSAIPGYPTTAGYTMVRYDIWKYTVTGAFVNGNAQFDIDGAFFGELTFPTGTLSGTDDFIPVVAGNYKVTIDFLSGEYSFI